jgi:hypothetical protein
MTINHRRWHAWLWLVLAPVLAVSFALGLRARPVPVSEPVHFAQPGAGPAVGASATAREVTP